MARMDVGASTGEPVHLQESIEKLCSVIKLDPSLQHSATDITDLILSALADVDAR